MDIPFDLLKLVAIYLVKPRMKLLNWIPKDKLDWNRLALNDSRGIIELFIYRNKFDDRELCEILSMNPHILEIVEMCNDYKVVRYEELSLNPYTVPMLEIYTELIDWSN